MHDGRPATSQLRVWGALLILYLVWGSTYLGIRIAVETIPPFFMAAIRFLAAGSLLIAWSLARETGGRPLPTRREWRDSLIVGAALLVGGMGLVAWGEQTVPSGIAALLIGTMPLWLAVLGRIFVGQTLPRAAGVGILVGLAGIAILAWPAGVGADRLNPFGTLALLISPLSWASGSLFAAHRAKLPRRPLLATGAQMLAGSPLLAIAGVATGELGQFHLDRISGDSAVALAYLILVGSGVAYTAYGFLLRSAPLSLVGTYAFVNPVVAVILGWIVLAEPIGPRQLLAAGVIVGAVALIITARGRAGRGAAPAAAERRKEAVGIAPEPLAEA